MSVINGVRFPTADMLFSAFKAKIEQWRAMGFLGLIGRAGRAVGVILFAFSAFSANAYTELSNMSITEEAGVYTFHSTRQWGDNWYSFGTASTTVFGGIDSSCTSGALPDGDSLDVALPTSACDGAYYFFAIGDYYGQVYQDGEYNWSLLPYVNPFSSWEFPETYNAVTNITPSPDGYVSTTTTIQFTIAYNNTYEMSTSSATTSPYTYLSWYFSIEGAYGNYGFQSVTASTTNASHYYTFTQAFGSAFSSTTVILHAYLSDSNVWSPQSYGSQYDRIIHIIHPSPGWYGILDPVTGSAIDPNSDPDLGADISGFQEVPEVGVFTSRWFSFRKKFPICYLSDMKSFYDIVFAPATATSSSWLITIGTATTSVNLASSFASSPFTPWSKIIIGWAFYLSIFYWAVNYSKRLISLF